MIIWICILLIFGALALLGYYQGALRFSISFIGMIAAAVLAMPAMLLTGPIVSMMGITNVIWAAAAAYLIGFFVMYGIGLGIAHFVHRKVEHYYKYSADDVVRLRWERMNRSLGVPLGLFGGAFWILLLGAVVYMAGYPTVQLSVDNNATGLARYLNMARNGLYASGLDKTAARFNTMPEQYYQISDILGLIYQNPALLTRLSDYPPFLLTGSGPEWQDLASDNEYQEALLSRGDITPLIHNPKTQQLMAAVTLVMATLQPDLNDLHEYLKTGHSPKYADEKLLGRWSIDVRATIAQERKKNPDMSTTEMRRLRRSAILLQGISFAATPDEKAILNLKLSQPAQQALGVAPAPAPTADPSADQQALQDRYGTTMQRPGGAAQPAPAARPELQQTVFASEGTWKNQGSHYQLSLRDERGRRQNAEAVVDEGRLVIELPSVTLVFYKSS